MSFTNTSFASPSGPVLASTVTLAGPFSVETEVRVKNLGPSTVWVGTDSGNLTPLPGGSSSGGGESVAVCAGETSPPILLPSSVTLYAVTPGGPAYVSFYYTQ